MIPFVNDTLDKTVIDGLCDAGVEMIALRCAGYNNVDRDAAAGRIAVVRVPGYSPYAVAEFTMGAADAEPEDPQGILPHP